MAIDTQDNTDTDTGAAEDLLGGEMKTGTDDTGADNKGNGGGSDDAGGSGSSDGSFDFSAAVAELPDELKSNESIKGFGSLEDMAKAAAQAKDLSAPEAYKDLDFDGITGTPEEAKAWEGVFKDANVSQSSAEKLIAATREMNEKAVAAAREAGAEALKKEHGNALDQVLADAKAGIAHFGGKDLQEVILASGFGSDPRMVNAWAKVKELITEDTHHGTGGGGTGMSPAMATEKISELKLDKEFMVAYKSAIAPGHKEAVEKMAKLHKIAAGG